MANQTIQENLKQRDLAPPESEEIIKLRQEIDRLKQENQEIGALRQEVLTLRQENYDLKMTLTTAIEHGDAIEEELYRVNEKLQQEALESRQSEVSLRGMFELLNRQKSDLEIMIQTLIDHGDMLDRQWYEKATQAKYLAEVDSLTQVSNRRKFDQYLNLQWQEMLQKGNPLVVLLCDIDYFKQYNDTYGHSMGDRCLQQVAQTLKTNLCRSDDLVARYGGEEFAIILPETDLQGGIKVADRLLKQVHQLKIDHAQSSVSPYVTMSIGLASMIPSPNHLPQDLFDEADRFLYLAKNQGRNQIIYSLVP
jgi:diguanylate cyclase (GGDEF)-like protein